MARRRRPTSATARRPSYGTTAFASTPNPVPFSSPARSRRSSSRASTPGTTYHYSIGGGTDHTFAHDADGRFPLRRRGRHRQLAQLLDGRAHPGPDRRRRSGVRAHRRRPHLRPAVSASRRSIRPSTTSMAWSTRRRVHARLGQPRVGRRRPTTTCATTRAGSCSRTRGPRRARPPPAAAAATGAGSTPAACASSPIPSPTPASTWTQLEGRRPPRSSRPPRPIRPIHFIVTFGHRPAYSTGFHPGEPDLAKVLDGFGDKYSKYVLNFNGHSHDYERFQPIHGVTHITTGGGGAHARDARGASTDPADGRSARCTCSTCASTSTSTGMRVEADLRPADLQRDDITCVQGSVIDSVTFGTNPPPPPTAAVHAVRRQEQLQLLGHRPGHVDAAVLLDQARGVAGGGRPDRPGLLRHLQRGVTAVELRHRERADQLRRHARGRRRRHRRHERLLDHLEELHQRRGLHRDRDHRRRDRRRRTPRNITIRGNHVTNARPAAAVQDRQGHPRRRHAPTRSIANNTVDHNTDYGIYLVDGSTRNQVTGQPDLRQRAGLAAGGLRHPHPQLGRQHDLVATSPTTTRTRASSSSPARRTTSSSTT